MVKVVQENQFGHMIALGGYGSGGFAFHCFLSVLALTGAYTAYHYLRGSRMWAPLYDSSAKIPLNIVDSLAFSDFGTNEQSEYWEKIKRSF